MFRKIQEKDKTFYIKTANEFYNSDAVDHKIPLDYIENTFNELIRSNEYTECYIFEKDGEKAGYALLAKTFSQEAGGLVVWIEEIYILPKFRSLGIGSDFLNFLKENTDCARLRLELCASNTRAYTAYKKHGFNVLDYNQMIYDKNPN